LAALDVGAFGMLIALVGIMVLAVRDDRQHARRMADIERRTKAGEP
jgi:hypothetical protein